MRNFMRQITVSLTNKIQGKMEGRVYSLKEILDVY